MRGLLLLLVFMNVVVFAWVRTVGSARPAAEPEAGAVRRLELASERAAAPAPTLTAAPRCLSVGPYPEQAPAERTAAALRTPQRDATLRQTENVVAVSFRVVLSVPTLQLAMSTASRLRAAGVTDVEIIPPTVGAQPAVVALGMFTDRERAARRLEDLRRYAIAPTLIEQPRIVTSWWLDVTARAAAAPLDAAALLKLIAAPTGIGLVQCPASGAGEAPPAAAPTPPSPPPGQPPPKPA